MIERVTKAICKSGRFETGQGTCALLCMDQLGDARRNCPHSGRLHGELAKACIKAMREPTDYMYEYLASHGSVWREQTSRGVWTTYIDAIIGD